jgi:hypothetical protein
MFVSSSSFLSKWQNNSWFIAINKYLLSGSVEITIDACKVARAWRRVTPWQAAVAAVDFRIYRKIDTLPRAFLVKPGRERGSGL